MRTKYPRGVNWPQAKRGADGPPFCFGAAARRAAGRPRRPRQRATRAKPLPRRKTKAPPERGFSALPRRLASEVRHIRVKPDMRAHRHHVGEQLGCVVDDGVMRVLVGLVGLGHPVGEDRLRDLPLGQRAFGQDRHPFGRDLGEAAGHGEFGRLTVRRHLQDPGPQRGDQRRMPGHCRQFTVRAGDLDLARLRGQQFPLGRDQVELHRIGHVWPSSASDQAAAARRCALATASSMVPTM